ncbi:alpha/beta fold hydrolase [Rugosimonospora africana]|uniref:Oxidoreductase n=1 Tax=Rugosimonospora africana TaxID=556532 RepID=A0A8J3QSY3_9ACTN|nr:alpha/beta hydrolase [Rugosimonospora africana]GIH16278.1 oxidoreductase [Rugosimonospora africana]
MQWEDKSASVGDYQIHYKQAGSGAQAVVLLHGIPTNSFLWHGVIPHLSQTYTVIAPDLLGYGSSDRAPQDELALPNQAEHVVKLLDALGIQQAHFVGHDLGGGIVQILSVKHPERVLSMVAADAVCFANWPLPKVSAMLWPTAPEFEPSTTLIGQMIRGGVYNPEVVTPAVLEAFTAPFASPSGPEELTRAASALDHHQTEDIVPDLPNVSVPVTLLWGQHDPYTTPFWGQKLQESIPNATLKILPDCSHYSMLDNPELVSRELLEHLNTQR